MFTSPNQNSYQFHGFENDPCDKFVWRHTKIWPKFALPLWLTRDSEF